MAQNTTPVFTQVPNIAWGTIATANTAKDGTGTVVTVFTADATNGSVIDSVIFRAAGTNVATVARIFINNGSANSTPANNTLIGEITLPATTLSETSALSHYEYPLGRRLPAGYKVNLTIGTTVSAGYAVTGIGANY